MGIARKRTVREEKEKKEEKRGEKWSERERLRPVSQGFIEHY